MPALLAAGHDVRVLTRSIGRAERFDWSDEVELRQGDVLDPASLPSAFEGCDTAFYLVHSMGGGDDFEDKDARAATYFRDAAAGANLRRIVYLGGMGGNQNGGMGGNQNGGMGGNQDGGVGAPRVATSGRRDPGIGCHAHHGTAGGDRHRVGVALVRDAPVPHRGAPGDDHTPLGAHPLPTDRHP